MSGGYTLRSIDDLQSVLHGAVKLAGDGLGVEAFGLQVLDLPPGFEQHPEHDHLADGQEEVYVVLRGSARFEINGVPVEAGADTIVRVDASARRRLVPGVDGVRVLAIGCRPGSYTRAERFRASVHS